MYSYSIMTTPHAKRHVKREGPSDTGPLLFPPTSNITARQIRQVLNATITSTAILTQTTVSVYANSYT
jgi:hypothetical protein